MGRVRTSFSRRGSRRRRAQPAIVLAVAALSSCASEVCSADPAFFDPGAGQIVLEADSLTGKLYIVGNNANINSYEIDSASGSLTFQSMKSPGGYNTLMAQTAVNSLPASNNPNERSWSIIASHAGMFVAEAYPAADTPAYDIIGPGMQVIDLNLPGLSAWTAGLSATDLLFRYGNGTGATLNPSIINLDTLKQWVGDGASNNWDVPSTPAKTRC